MTIEVAMRIWCRMWIGFIVFGLGLQCVFAKVVITRNVEGPKEELAFDILKLALSKSAPEIELKQSPESYDEVRLVDEVESNRINVMWSGVDNYMEEHLLTVRIPILKGLLGHRIFIIRAADQNKFSKINTLDELKHFYAGQGTFWGDTKVLKKAGIPIRTTIKYPNLFPMLEGGRFDYFPRAVHEPWVEVKKHADLNLVVDKHIMLIYPFAMYFFVNKNDIELHDNIYEGFEMAISDGSYDQLFFSHPMIKEALEQANLSKRIIFKLDNPYMSPDTPYNRPEFWLDISKLK